jgi:chaperonin GroEL
VSQIDRKSAPELLDNDALIAQHLVQVKDRDINIGVSLLRETLKKLDDEIGDGTGTCAVLFQTILNQSNKLIINGANAIVLKNALLSAGRIVEQTLLSMTMDLTTQKQLVNLAFSASNDSELSNYLAEIFHIVGEYGHLEIRESNSQETSREYIEGMHWEGGLFSRLMSNVENNWRAEFKNCSVLVSNFRVDDPRQLLPILEKALKTGVKKLVFILEDMTEDAIAPLLLAQNKSKIKVFAIRLPLLGKTEQWQLLEDLSICTGGKPHMLAAGDCITTVELSDLGSVRFFWADKTHFGFIGGKGDRKKMRAQWKRLLSSLDYAKDQNQIEKIQARISKYIGGSAVMWVGGQTPLEVKNRLDKAKRTSLSIRRGLKGGILPGGGSAYWHCRRKLFDATQSVSEFEEHAALKILIDALEAPLRQILLNAGLKPDKWIYQLEYYEEGWGVDVKTKKIVNMLDAGIFDTATASIKAFRLALQGAALALTTDTLVHLQ